MSGPRRDSEYIANFTGKRMPEMPAKPDLSKVKYGKPIALFNGKDLSGWVLMNPKQKTDSRWRMASWSMTPFNPKMANIYPMVILGQVKNLMILT